MDGDLVDFASAGLLDAESDVVVGVGVVRTVIFGEPFREPLGEGLGWEIFGEIFLDDALDAFNAQIGADAPDIWGDGDDGFCTEVEFIIDVAHERFDEVFEGDHAHDVALVVFDDGNVVVTSRKAFEGIGKVFVFVECEDWADEGCEVESVAMFAEADEVFVIDVAVDVVGVVVGADGVTGVHGVLADAEVFACGAIEAEVGDVGSWDHDFVKAGGAHFDGVDDDGFLF